MSATLKPIKWHGGKHYLAQRIIAMMPAHSHYLEPFAGGLAVLLQKPCEGVSEAVNDLCGDLSTFWWVLADPTMFERFYRRVECMPFSQPLFEYAKQGGTHSDPVSRAVAFFVRARQSRQGLQRDYCTPTRRTRRGMNEHVSAWLTAVDGLPDVHQRLRRVEIRCMDAVAFIRQYDHEGALFYLDPPYLHETRASVGEYAHEMTPGQHSELLETLAGIKGKFLLSGYPSDLYDVWASEHGYACERIRVPNSASGAKRKDIKTEVVWRNY